MLNFCFSEYFTQESARLSSTSAIFNIRDAENKSILDFEGNVWVDSSDFEGHCGHIYKEAVVANTSIKAFGQKRYKVPFHKGVVDL